MNAKTPNTPTAPAAKDPSHYLKACETIAEMDSCGFFIHNGAFGLEKRDRLQDLLCNWEAEHTALVAVAETVELCLTRYPLALRNTHDAELLAKALANLAAVRGQTNSVPEDNFTDRDFDEMSHKIGKSISHPC